jgi:fatty-acyl-CoA synthase
MLANCPEFIELYLACSRLGAVFVPISFRLAAPELDYILKNARPRLLVFGKQGGKAVEGLDGDPTGFSMRRSGVGLEGAVNWALDYAVEVGRFEGKRPFVSKPRGPADPEEPHVIMFTSGTTGRPKGAVLSHRKTFFNCLNADIFFKLHFDDVMLIVLPLFHSGGLFIQASPILYKGATMVLHERFDEAEVYRAIASHRVTKFLGVPTIYRALLKVDPDRRGDLTSLAVSAIGGEKTSHELLLQCNQAGFPLRQIMGQTETSILLWASEEDSLRKPGTVGRPVFHAEVGLMDPEGRPVRQGEVGEIVVRGSIMMKEYWQDPAATEETIRSGWLRTGDLAMMDEEGYFFLVDREKEMYISGGENVYPAEVERVLREHPAVEDVAVVGIPDAAWGEVGEAFIVLKPGEAITDEAILSFCEGKLAPYKWPKRVTLRANLPRTPLGKVRKWELRTSG